MAYLMTLVSPALSDTNTQEISSQEMNSRLSALNSAPWPLPATSKPTLLTLKPHSERIKTKGSAAGFPASQCLLIC